MISNICIFVLRACKKLLAGRNTSVHIPIQQRQICSFM